MLYGGKIAMMNEKENEIFSKYFVWQPYIGLKEPQYQGKYNSSDSCHNCGGCGNCGA
ncbi:MAG: hypothetical protein LAKADJCE_00308 [Candidatus Argoarchaeum ethanivorans]|uniref:Uncharacterized protein n=1 Tax=Candidatus Argoarchaeum ethanivorans TaxID=2608793 RepID=A0A811T9C2_9EURY|nr:MAG: hypothetical protein LAKADJCE_00308 [Candidatus Argoarchaeum ethanivorans]